MKSRRIKFVKKTAVWLMTVILVINYCVNIALAAEGIGKDELPADAVVAGEVTVHVPVNPDAVVDAAIFQANSGVMPMAGALPVGSVTVEGIPVTASVTFSVEAETFAEKCAALTVGDFDPAMVFDADYRSALRQDASTAAVWQEAAAMLDGVAILNGSDRLVNLVVEPVQTGDAVALAPEAASLVAGEPLEEEASGGQERPDTEDGTKDEAAGEEEKTTDPEDEPAGETDGGDVSDSEIQEPDDREEPEKSDPEDQPDSSMEEEVPGEGPADAAADEEDAVLDETEDEAEDEPEEEPDTEPRDEPEEAGNEEPETEDEPEETGEGSVEANAGRQEHVIFYETAGNDAPFGEPDGEDVSGEPEQQDQKTEEPAGDTGDERQDDAAADDVGEDGRDAGNGTDEENQDAGDGADEENQDTGDDPDGEEPAPLPEETIEQAEGSVTVMNVRPMGGVLMSFRAAAPLANNGKITIKGTFVSQYDDELNAEFAWYCKTGKEFTPIHGSDVTHLKGWVDASYEKITALEDVVEIPYLDYKASKDSTVTIYLGEIPASGVSPTNEPLGHLDYKNGVTIFTPNENVLQTNGDGTYTRINQETGAAYQQYVASVANLGQNMMVGDQPVYCFNNPYAVPTVGSNGVRYLKGDADPKLALYPSVPEEKLISYIRKAMQFGYPGNGLGLQESLGHEEIYGVTQKVIWKYTDRKGTDDENADLIDTAVKSDSNIGSTERGEASVTLKIDNKVLADNETVVFTLDEEKGVYRSPEIAVEGLFETYVLSLQNGQDITVYGQKKIDAGGDFVKYYEKLDLSVPQSSRVIYLEIPQDKKAESASFSIEVTHTWFEEIEDVLFFTPVNAFIMTLTGGKNPTSVKNNGSQNSKKYQNLIGYGSTGQTTTAKTGMIALSVPTESTASLTLKKVAAEAPDKPLKGAGFKLEKHENNRWVPVSGGEALTTNENGLATVANLSFDVPYKLTEITPPAGYDLLESPVLFMLADNGGSAAVYQVNEENGTYSRGGLWAAEGQGITVSGLTMTVPNTARQDPEKTLKLHLDHLVQPGYNDAYDAMVDNAEFQFALVKGAGAGAARSLSQSAGEAVVVRGSVHGQSGDVTWDNGSETVELTEGVYYLFGYDVPQPFQRVIHAYQTAKNSEGGAFDSTFDGTSGASDSELREAASKVSGTPYMGVKITVTDADMTAFNGGTLYYHAESNLPMGRLTVNKTYYNRTYHSAGDEFRFEIRKLDGKTDTFDQGTYYQTVTVRAGDGSQSIDLPYGIYAIRETGMPSRYSFNIFASGAGVAYNPLDNFARFSFPRSLLDSGTVNPANEWQVTVTAENRVHNDGGNDDDDDDDDSYRSEGTTEGGGGGSDPGRRLFNHDDLVNIPEEAVPLSDKPLVEIPDEDVPLGALPNTGGFSMGVFAVLGAAITAIGVFLRKGKQSKA